MRRASIIFAGLVLAVPGAARAEPGGFFKNMFGGSEGGASVAAPRAQDPDDVYCPPVFVPDGGAAIQAFAGAAGDNRRLRHQIVFSRLSRECKARPDGSVAVRVGVELRALLGPAGTAGRFEAPVTIAVKYNEQPVMARTHRVAVAVPAGAVQGEATVIENDLSVPADKAMGYDIEVTLAGAATRAKSAVRRRKPAPAAAAEQSEAAAEQ
ncbi:hypothetical protein ABEV34_12080 [Methylorubrum rhodesianum]|jgi:hypothetical protein|uniref:hypothetical protein n=1 Tax=Methylorubrum TaxID=2282523 RepID=UPI00034DFB80|nr:MULTISPECIES: hypothetical protein [Methylorubrum]MBB5765400.1 hypothetical protein [Methylorubrum rhodesianum]MBI1691598.1 hypothetical protein [Methylorubrum sp. DB1722]